MRILILGGTGEAGALIRGLAPQPGLDLTLSLAGRTASPRPEPVRTRIGGFGGPEGLAAFLGANGITHLVDATHPFAARISHNAALAAAQAGVPLLAIRRPAWERVEGDDWIDAESMPDAAAALGATPRTVFLTIGRQEVAAFAQAPLHDYLVRSIEPVDDGPIRMRAILARGPFDAPAEAAFLRENRVAVLVSKNAGGPATYGKIAAARGLGIPVVMVRRPDKPDVPAVASAEAAVRRLLALI